MASLVPQRCTPAYRVASRRTAPTLVPAQPVRHQRVVVRSGLSDVLDIGRNDRKALLHSFYHDLDLQKLVSPSLRAF